MKRFATESSIIFVASRLMDDDDSMLSTEEAIISLPFACSRQARLIWFIIPVIDSVDIAMNLLTFLG
jgi:hypothetical protein